MTMAVSSLPMFALYALVGGFCFAAGSALFSGILGLFGRKATA